MGTLREVADKLTFCRKGRREAHARNGRGGLTDNDMAKWGRAKASDFVKSVLREADLFHGPGV